MFSFLTRHKCKITICQQKKGIGEILGNKRHKMRGEIERERQVDSDAYK